MTLFEELKWRGLVYDMTSPDLEKKINEGGLKFYVGIDPTAPSVHIGTLAIILLAKRLQDRGHKAVIIAGGGTGLIGDPKPNSERPMISIDEVKFNVECQKKQFENIINCDIINNIDWLGKMDMVTYLRDYGKYININYMISKDTVKSRLESGISYTEFSYMLLQGIDFLKLYENENVNMQIGGQDQWGNITTGLEFIRKIHGSDVEAYGMTMPLVLKSDGTKFGKTESGTVWLDSARTSPYEMYQFFLNTSDADVINFLKKFSFKTPEEIMEIEKSFIDAPHERLAQKSLAEEVTIMIHGKEALNKAIEMTSALFSGNLSNLSVDEIKTLLKDSTVTEIASEINILDLLMLANAATSKREAREFVLSGAVSVNDNKIIDPEKILNRDDTIDGTTLILKRGKKKYFIINFK